MQALRYQMSHKERHDMNIIKCAVCGVAVVRTGRAQKYCPICAYAIAKERSKLWYKLHCVKAPSRHCKICGSLINSHRSFCDQCIVEHRRSYQREYYQRKRKSS